MSEWKMVPVEPTPEMLKAAVQELHPASYWEDAYRTMLSAAPQPEQKPVAWMYFWPKHEYPAETMHIYKDRLSDEARAARAALGVEEFPLYTGPQPTEQEAVNSLERECNALTDKKIEQRRLIEDLASMCRRMSYALNRAGGSDTTVRQCIDLLKRHDLGGSIIRTEQVAKPTDSGREG